MNNCDAWCQLSRSPEEYRARIRQAVQMLEGKYKETAQELRAQMESAAEALDFERAAALRDRLLAVESLGQRQLVTAGSMASTDVIGYYQSEAKGCFAVLHYVNGNLLDKDYEILAPSDDAQEAVSTLVKQYYLARGAAPKEILLPVEMDDATLFEQLLYQELKKKVHIRKPVRGDGVRLVELAQKNAREEAERVTTKAERAAGVLTLMQGMLGLPQPPQRLEAYDISNTAGTDIVASMVVYVDGRPCKKDYKHFKVEGLRDQDDYASMKQVLERRFAHFLAGDAGFSDRPDALLIDGGVEHANVALNVLREMSIEIPVFGMVKDDRHRTRALVTPDGQEIAISAVPAVFAFIGGIQEEVHRFAITYHRLLRSKRMRESELEKIPGIGEKRRQLLLKKFKSVTAVKNATQQQLCEVLSEKQAEAVYAYFHGGKDTEEA